MPDASAIRTQIEASLTNRFPSALTPVHRALHPVAETGINPLDELLGGGLPVGAITEMTGPECSGLTSLVISFVARLTRVDKVCAWVDVSNTFDPESAAATGLDLSRLLWVRCGVTTPDHMEDHSTNGFAPPGKYLIPAPITKGLHGGGFGPHPRGEVKGLSDAIGSFLQSEMIAPRCAEPQRRVRSVRDGFALKPPRLQMESRRPSSICKPWGRIDQALRVTDLLLQGGGFSAIVLDMGGIAPEYASRVPMATWFRYRAAAERTQCSVLLLNQYACAKSSAALVLRLQPGNPLQDKQTVFTGIECRIDIERQRFAQATNVVPMRKPPQPANSASWRSRTLWAGRR